MKKYILLLPLAILLGAIVGIIWLEREPQAPSTPDAFQQPPREMAQFDGIRGDYFTLDPAAAVAHDHLQLIPIRGSKDYLKTHGDFAQLLSLKAALATRQVIVRELGESAGHTRQHTPYDPNPLSNPIWTSEAMPSVSDELSEAMANGASVNSLVIENHSDTAIYIMAGEVVQGGKQDRVIAEDIIAMPGEKYIVPVFCVEPGRWNYHETPQPHAVPTESQPEMIFAFTGYFNVASHSIRHTVKHNKSQSQVWAQVSDVRQRNAVKGNTTTYGDLAQSRAFMAQQQQYTTTLEGAFTGQDDVIGVMAVSGDKVLAIDLFATPQLFQQQYSGLVHGFATEAITYGAAPQLDASALQAAFAASQQKYFERQADETTELAMKFVSRGKVVHFTDLQGATREQ